MRAYDEAYLRDVMENQGKLFDLVSQNYPDKDTIDFIAAELWDYFRETEGFKLKDGKALQGFLPDWLGEFYAYYQWYYHIPSSEVIKKVPTDFLIKAYAGLHDLDLALAVKKVGM